MHLHLFHLSSLRFCLFKKKKKKLVIALHGQENSPWQVIYITYSFIYWPHHMARGILVPQPGIEPPPSALGACSLNHWTLAVIFETSGN